MKKILTVTALFLSLSSFAQQEIKLNLFSALVFKTVDVSYEYYINSQTSVGISAFKNFEKRDASLRYDQDAMITPYFRHYFTNSQVWNTFGEAFFGINTGEKRIEKSGVPTRYVGYTDGALGVGVGTKYSIKSGLIIEAVIGLGRNLFGDTSPIIVPRVGLNVGYRF